MEKFFNVENLCFAYLKKPLCLKDFSFFADKNDNLLILGLDDRGKTTLLTTLSGFEDKFFGKVLLDGREIRTIADTEKNVSLILDYPVLLPGSIDKNLDFLYSAIQRDVPTNDEKLGLLKKFNLNYDLKTNVKKITNFERFKLCFLRSYVKGPRVIFVDDILKNNFSADELAELKLIFQALTKDRLFVFSSNEKSFKENLEFFESFDWSKVLYLNNAKLTEKKDLQDFLLNPIDLDACLFNNSLCFHEGYCIRQDGGYYLKIEEKFVIKIDKNLNDKFDKLKLADLENEDIVVAYNLNQEVDFNRNNDFNKLISRGSVMIFSKLDRSRIL